MNKDKQLQYYTKIAVAINSIFNNDNENYIDVFEDDFSANDFIHVLATRVPQMVVAKLTNNNYDALEFNHVCNKLIVQDIMHNQSKV